MANDIFVTMGGDFKFMHAYWYFANSDRLIEYYNANEGAKNNIRLIYSTPSMYVAALAAQNIKWPTKYDDIFPYADDADSYWTGFFTSRPNDKAKIRLLSQIMHAQNKLYTLEVINQNTTTTKI
jgi:hypothetical protein